MQEKDFISVKNLVKEFPIRGGFFNKQTGAVHAVNNISFEIQKGETLGLVGESGCGKSTAGRCILGLTPPTGGCVKIGGINVNTSDPKIRKSLRKRIKLCSEPFFQPYRDAVEKILKEPLIYIQNSSVKK